MKVTIKGYIHKGTASYDQGFHFFGNKDMTDCGFVLVGPHEFEYEVPESFNQVAAEVAALEKTLDKLSDEHMKKVQQIKGRIQELLCIENQVQA